MALPHVFEKFRKSPVFTAFLDFHFADATQVRRVLHDVSFGVIASLFDCLAVESDGLLRIMRTSLGQDSQIAPL